MDYTKKTDQICPGCGENITENEAKVMKRYGFDKCVKCRMKAKIPQTYQKRK